MGFQVTNKALFIFITCLVKKSLQCGVTLFVTPLFAFISAFTLFGF